MKKSLTVIAAIFTFGCGMETREPDTTEGVVFVRNLQLNTACTGALIAPNLVLTARHCIAKVAEGKTRKDRHFKENSEPQNIYIHQPEDETSLINYGDDPNKIRARMILTPDFEDNGFYGRDIAAIVLSQNVAKDFSNILKINPEPAKTNETVQLLGFGFDLDINSSFAERTSSWGTIQCRNISCEIKLTFAEWQSNPYGCRGDSGGPLLNQNNEIIGVAGLIFLETEDKTCSNRVIATSTAYYLEFIQEALEIADQIRQAN